MKYRNLINLIIEYMDDKFKKKIKKMIKDSNSLQEFLEKVKQMNKEIASKYWTEYKK